MGVYIKGMEMPTCCFKCGFYHHSVDDGYYDFEYCGANNAEFNNAYDSTKPHINPFEEKLNNCPLVPVQPHGRLIDADALIEDLERQCKEVFHIDAVSPDDYWITRNEAYNEALWKSWVESFGEYLKACLTIIPAEEADK